MEKRLLYILSLMKPPVDETPKVLGTMPASAYSLSVQKKTFSELIVLVLQQDLSASTIEYVLMKLDADILPYFSRPVQLTDFLTDCFNYGGVLSVMSLSGLYEMITRYNVNYPDYFDKLYSLLNDQVFSLK